MLTLLLPASFFASVDRIVPPSSQRTEAAITESLRGNVLDISRALSLLLVVTYVVDCPSAICLFVHVLLFSRYIGTRIYLHNPPGEESLDHLSNAPKAFKDEVAKVEQEEPVVNPWVCIITLIIAVILLAFTAEHVRPVSKRRGVFPYAQTACYQHPWSRRAISLVARVGAMSMPG